MRRNPDSEHHAEYSVDTVSDQLNEVSVNSDLTLLETQISSLNRCIQVSEDLSAQQTFDPRDSESLIYVTLCLKKRLREAKKKLAALQPRRSSASGLIDEVAAA